MRIMSKLNPVVENRFSQIEHFDDIPSGFPSGVEIHVNDGKHSVSGYLTLTIGFFWAPAVGED